MSTPRNDRIAECARCLRFAEEDLGEAEALIRQPRYVPRHACFLAQQATEKALKTVLIFLGLDVPHLHNLNALRNLIPNSWPLTQEHPDLTDLTEWAIEARYPGDWPESTRLDAETATQQARAVMRSVERDLLSHGYA